MIATTPAIVLAIHPWSRTSHMVTWLSEEFGKIVTPVKGACRPKSAFLGQYDLFYTCELSFYKREHDGIHAIRECVPVEFRENLRKSWKGVATASYLSDLASRVSAVPQESQKLFRLLTQTLDRLNQLPPPDFRGILIWFEVQLLHLLGLQPDLNECPYCREEQREWLRFSLPAGHLICRHRPKRDASEITISLHQSVKKLFLRLQRAPVGVLTEPLPILFTQKNFAENQNPLLGLSRFLGIFMRYHLEVPPAVRRVAWDMIETKNAEFCQIGK